MSGQTGTYVGCAVFVLVGLALAYLGYARYRDNPSNSLWLFTGIAGLLAAACFVALLIAALASPAG